MQTTTDISTSRFDSPYGPLLVRMRGGVVLALRRWQDDDSSDAALDRRTDDTLTAYFAGERRRLDLPTEAVGTPFQCAVWSAMTDIGWGELTTYAALAELIGRPGCARAVGQAVSSHPAPLLAGSHRVLSSDGRLAGADAAAVVWKAALLRLEGHVVHDGRLVEDARAAA